MVFAAFADSESTKVSIKLSHLVNKLDKDLNNIPEKFPQIVVKSGALAGPEIRDFARKNGYHCICTDRHGKGRTGLLFGSVSTTLIKSSDVPVILVPVNYRTTAIQTVCYLSDLHDLDKKLKIVSGLAALSHAKAELLHFNTPVDYLNDDRKINQLKEKLTWCKVAPHFETFNYEKTLIGNIDKFTKHAKPGVIIMFSRIKRFFLEDFFLPGISAGLSSVSSVPLLIFRKS